MQDRPVCLGCDEPVSASDAVFEAPCGHDECPSAVFHGICLMDWRENREAAMKRMRVFVIDMEKVIEALMEDDDY